jgi:hypothetical protein
MNNIFNEELVEISNIHALQVTDIPASLQKHNIFNNINNCNYVLYIRFELDLETVILNKFRFNYVTDIQTLIKYNELIFEYKNYIITFYKDFKNADQHCIFITKSKLLKIENILKQIKLTSKINENEIDYETCNIFLNDYSRYISTFDGINLYFAQSNNTHKHINLGLCFANLIAPAGIPLSVYKYLSYKDTLNKRLKQAKAKQLKLL